MSDLRSEIKEAIPGGSINAEEVSINQRECETTLGETMRRDKERDEAKQSIGFWDRPPKELK